MAEHTTFTEFGPHAPAQTPPEFEELAEVTFFVPCFNEEANVINTVNKLVAVSAELGLTYEIVVFDDGSTDRTVERVKTFQAEHPELRVRLLINRVNQGVARNFVEAGFQGRGKYFRLICGDDVEPKETLRKILEKTGEADIIIPYHTKVEGRSQFRRVLSRTYTKLVNLASGQNLHYYNGMPLFRRYDVMRFHVEATGLGYQAEFLLRLLQEGRSFVEVPLIASDRAGSMALNFRNFLSVGYSLFKILVRRTRNAMFGVARNS